MSWQGYKTNKRNTEEEIKGAEYCVYLLKHRDWSKNMCQWFGEKVFNHYITKNEGFANGFREMAYTIAKTRLNRNSS